MLDQQEEKELTPCMVNWPQSYMLRGRVRGASRHAVDAG